MCDQPDQPDATIKIIASDLGTKRTGRNDKSMVMSLRIEARKKMLFLGDFESESAYNYLLWVGRSTGGKKYVDEIRNHQIVMVPHHGSSNNGNPNAIFYNAVNPTYAIVSSAILSSCSSTKFPKVETLQAICRRNTVVLVTLWHPYAGPLSLPIGWRAYSCYPDFDDSYSDESLSCDSDDIYRPEYDCPDSRYADPGEMVTMYKLQKLQNCDIHIYQTSKPLFDDENEPNKLRLFTIVTRISATNTIVTADQYGGDIPI